MKDTLHNFDNIKWTAAFEVTRYCNMACDICGVESGPNAPFKFMDTNRIKDILVDASKSPNFSESFILSGGEVTTAYSYDKGYVGRLLQIGQELKMRCTLRTNGKISGKNLAALADDMVPFAYMGRRAHKALRIGLSLDASHKNSFEYNLRMVKVLTRNVGLPSKVFFIVSVGNANEQLAEFARGLDMPISISPDTGAINKIGDIAVQNECNVYNVGRAKENNIGTENISDLDAALQDIGRNGMIWFSVNNTASFIYKFNPLLSTSMHDMHNRDKNLSQIMIDLRNQCIAQMQNVNERGRL